MEYSIIPIIFIFLFLIIIAIIAFILLNPWFMAYSNGIKISPLRILSMIIRKVDSKAIIESAIMLKENSIFINLDDLEMHYLGGGNLNKITKALISAKRSDLNVSFKYVSALDLSGNDPEEAILEYIQPKELEINNLTYLNKNNAKFEVGFKTIVRRSPERPVSLSLNTVIDYIKNQIEEEIYNTDSNSIDIDSLIDKIKKNSINKTAISIIDLKIYIKALG